jgi:acetolactate synthase-1/2/3 large subunit
MYGTIRMHQERTYPDRVIGTDLASPDFAAIARACGATAECVETTEAFDAAVQRLLNASGPALLHLRTDPRAIATRLDLEDLRRGART